MKIKRSELVFCRAVELTVAVLLLVTWATPAQQLQSEDVEQIQRVAVPPPFGTFYFIQNKNSPPYPFDPFFGQLPVYEWKPGVYIVDDAQVDYAGWNEQKATMKSEVGFGSMSMMSGPAPCDPCPGGGGGTNAPGYVGGWTTNAGLKFGPTPIVQAGVFSTWLQGADVNSAYEIYERFQISTNFPWQRIAAGQIGQTNFSWWLLATNTAFYLAADSIDSDFDGLSDAFEQLVSHTLPEDEDSDNDGVLDGDEDFDANGIPDSVDFSRLSQAVIFASQRNAYEGGADGEVTILLPFAAPTNGTKIILHLGGTAEFASDYQLFTVSGSPVTNDVVFAAGDWQKKLLVRPINDAEQASRSRSVSLALAWSTNFLLDSRRANVLLIDNDPPLVSIVASDPKAMEATGTATNKGEFIIRRYGTNQLPLTVQLSRSGTASNGVDYSTLASTAIIPAGSNQITLTVNPLPDAEYEDTEGVTLTILANAAYAVSTNNTATVNILDDDLPTVSFIATDPVATEYNSLKAGVITLRRTGNLAKPLTVPLAVGGTASRATNNLDYQIFTNSVQWFGSNVTFAPNSNNVAITIKPVADILEEQAETVMFTIKGSVAYKIGTSNSVMAFIDDDHTTRYEVVQRKIATVYEPGTIDSPAIFDLLRWGRSSLAAQVPFEMGTNAAGGPIRTTYYRKYGDISGENFVFAPFATKARLNATSLAGGGPGTGTGAIHLKVPSIDTSIYPMWMRPKHQFVRLEIIQTNAVEGTTTRATLRATRLFNGPAVQVYFTVAGNAVISGQPGADHNLAQSVQFPIPTNVFVVETNISAVADVNLEGWETVILSHETLAIQTTYDFHPPYMVFLRDNVTTVTGLPETDTDRDGMSDRWEVANGFDPFTAGEESLDPDKDGLINSEEAALGLNPQSADSDGDLEDDFAEANHQGMTDENYLEVRLFTLDTGKVNNGMNCAVCHTTQFKVGDFTHFSPTHGSGLEKSFFFKRGTNYPIYLSDLIQNLPPAGPTGSNPTTTEQYTAGIVPAENEPRAFVVNDPNHKLGTNKLWSNFPADPTVSIGTLIVPKIEVFWTNYPGNIVLDNNTNTGGGVRVFPDQTSPADNSTTRNRVRVRVKTTPPLNGQTVRLKAFDVDDPSPEVEEVRIDSNDLPGITDIGNDNRGTPQTGQLAQVVLTLNAQGEATTDFTLTMQPGDNFRVAALLDTANATAHLNQLQVTSDFAEFYVGPNNDGIPGFVGGISPMLTVWRKLHLEIDSMDAPPASGPEANPISGDIVSVKSNSPVPGHSRVTVRHASVEEGVNLFERGKLEIAGVGTYRILKSATRLAGGNQFVTEAEIDGLPGAVPNFTPARLFDDDDQYLADDPLYRSALGLQSPPLPLNQRSAEFITNIQPAYAQAYILPVNANALGFNSQPIIPFKRHAPAFAVTGTPFDAGNLQLKGSDRSEFWAFSVAFGYEFEFAVAVPFFFRFIDDGDPDRELQVLEGATPKTSQFLIGDANRPLGYTVLFMENIRESHFQGISNPEQLIVPSVAADKARDYRDRLYAVIAHELGHAPGRQNEGSDHAEGNVMQVGGVGNLVFTKFSGKSIVRFRKTTSWTQ